ncbi:hypothetical protein KJ969_00740 [Patescibacteria group bacterium]|nr:hypothetical protein [Patescibacteria group bacterium]MBU1922064.1 hypothetical protein [Patescibacteria group bacterium]
MDPLKELQGFDAGRVLALIKKLGGRENVDAVLRDELTVELKKAIKALFDRHGRRIPAKDFEFAFCDPDTDYHLNQPELDLVERFKRFCDYFGDPGITLQDFQVRTGELLDMVSRNKPIANLVNAVCLPIILGKLPEEFDYGELLEQKFIVAVEKAFLKQFPDRTFKNHRKGELAGEIKIVHESHERLITRLKELKQGSEVALYFPNPLQGFSVLASREQMKDLPKEIHLCGGVDTCTGTAMYADVLARDWHTPGLDMAALSWHSSGYSLCFEAGGGILGFDGRAGLAYACDDYSSGLVVLG